MGLRPLEDSKQPLAGGKKDRAAASDGNQGLHENPLREGPRAHQLGISSAVGQSFHDTRRDCKGKRQMKLADEY